MTEWNWWNQPYIRLPKIVRQWAGEGLLSTVEVQIVDFQREKWWMSPIYNPKTGEVEKLTHISGVPGTEQHGLSWIFPAWRCQKCKVVFIVGDFHDLRHECTE